MFYFLGDSHVRPVRTAISRGFFGDVPCKIEEVGGATAVGLRHPTSTTQALPRFRECILPHDSDVVPVFQLGEVDCGFVIWVRAQRHGESIQQQLLESLNAYRNFIVETRDAGYSGLVVTSAMLPTLYDGALLGEVALLRREVRASYRDRTDLTLEYNMRLKEICGSEQITYADFMPHLLDPDTRLLRNYYRHPDPRDHHLHPERTGALWARLVHECIMAG